MGNAFSDMFCYAGDAAIFLDKLFASFQHNSKTMKKTILEESIYCKF